MNIHLTPEQERVVRDELKSGQFGSIEEVISKALEALGSAPPTLAQREAVRDMLAFVEKNRVHLDGVSVKDLIHEGQPIPR